MTKALPVDYGSLFSSGISGDIRVAHLTDSPY